MAISHEAMQRVKEKAVEEFWRLVLLWIYLAMLLCAFLYYRQLVLAEYHITYFGITYGVVQALILAKVILIGEAMQMGNWLRPLPRAYVVLYKTLMFSLMVVVLSAGEHLVRGWFEGQGMAGIQTALAKAGRDEILGRMLIMAVSFVPLFSFAEIGELMGEGQLMRFFFGKGRPKAGITPGGDVRTA